MPQPAISQCLPRESIGAYADALNLLAAPEKGLRNQGASLTAWELAHHGVAHTVIADNTGGHLMQHGMVDLVIVGDGTAGDGIDHRTRRVAGGPRGVGRRVSGAGKRAVRATDSVGHCNREQLRASVPTWSCSLGRRCIGLERLSDA